MSEISNKIESNYIPITGSGFSENYGQWFLFVEYWLIGILLYYINAPYIKLCQEYPIAYIIFPLAVYGFFYQIALLSLVISKIYLMILLAVHPVQEGWFDIASPDYRWYCRRYWATYFPFYFIRATPLPWADMVVFRVLGMRAGKNVCLYDAWSDMELIEIGDFVMLSLNAGLLSHCIYHESIYIKKVVIEKNSIVGADSLVSPGVYIKEGAILGAAASTKLDQELDGYLTHIGNPVSKQLPIKIQETKILDPEPEAKESTPQEKQSKQDKEESS